jgi:hypothetical protein
MGFVATTCYVRVRGQVVVWATHRGLTELFLGWLVRETASRQLFRGKNIMKAMKSTIGLVSAFALGLFGVTGCGTEYEEEKDEPAPDFVQVGQEEIPGAVEYAPGPYGYDKGKIIPNFKFIGFASYTADPGLTWVQLADFYNPTGTEVFPEGSPYGAGTSKPTALLMIMSAAWCGPCKQEANDLKTKFPDKLQPGGGHVLGLLVEAVNGDPADYYTATSWAQAYSVQYTLAIDPTRQALSIYEPAFPGNMIIRTSDMKIIEIVAGSPDATHPFWATFEAVKNGTYGG